MTKRTTMLPWIASAVMLAAVVAGAQAAGQADTKSAPVAEKDAGKTVPIKVTTRVYDKKVLLSAPVLNESQQRGRALWQQRCAYCHDGVGQPTYKTMGDWIGAETVESLGEEAMKAFINTGTARMPSFKYELDSRQMDDLLAFIKTVPSSEKPTKGQLEGKAAAADSSD